ncbi:MAG: DUF4139 domain-containing protein [Gemmatimonadota bacterium]|nr:DUF4139 domain-containing protein [Gemmatimonadota bacterium]
MWNRLLVGLMGTATVAAAGGGTPQGTTTPESHLEVGAPAADTVVMSSGAEDRRTVSITVYNQNFSLVREVRRMRLPGGSVALEYGDVAATLQPETVHIRGLDSRNLQVLEQNYRYDLLSPQKLLEKYVGRTVTVYRHDPEAGREVGVPAEVLSVNGGTVLRIGDEITFNYPGRFAFPEVPNNLIPEPTLVWMLETEGGTQDVEVSYLTQDMTWKSDYVLVLADDERSAGITGWVTLDNRSGAGFENAELKLVAGDVQRVSGQAPRVDYAADMLRAAEAESRGFTEEGFFEYHLYTLGRPTDLLNNEQKQVTLLESERLRTAKRLVFPGAPYYYRSQYGEVASNQKVSTFIEFDNSEDAGMGMALPAGIVRVYKRDSSGAQQFIGEDRIDHTPRDERVRIKMGEAFDVVGDRRQMTWEVVSGCVSESSWVVELRNHKDEDVEVDVVEPVGGDWTILSASHEWERLDSGTFRFQVDVPARGETTIEYRVRVRWC